VFVFLFFFFWHSLFFARFLAFVLPSSSFRGIRWTIYAGIAPILLSKKHNQKPLLFTENDKKTICPSYQKKDGKVTPYDDDCFYYYKSSLVPLIEGLCAQIYFKFEISVVCSHLLLFFFVKEKTC